MASLQQKRSRRLWVILCLLLGLIALQAMATPLLGDNLANQFGTDVILAAEPANGG